MDCCELASTAIKVTAVVAIGCLVLAVVVVLIAFKYAFKGKFGNKEISAKPTVTKNVLSKEKGKKTKLTTDVRNKKKKKKRQKAK